MTFSGMNSTKNPILRGINLLPTREARILSGSIMIRKKTLFLMISPNLINGSKTISKGTGLIYGQQIERTS